MSNKLKELEQLINNQLSNCNSLMHPTVCQMKQNEKAYKELYSDILQRCVKKGISVNQAINEIEKEYNPNINTDQ
jgi:hypothetical protein